MLYYLAVQIDTAHSAVATALAFVRPDPRLLLTRTGHRNDELAVLLRDEVFARAR
jgi:hypothetical protein